MIKPPPPAQALPAIRRHSETENITRSLPSEVAVAMTYDSATYAVLMASPIDLEDFAVGFSFSEGIIETPNDIFEFEVAVLASGIDCQMRIAPGKREALQQRRRHLAGPMGCGLCGIDSLAEAMRAPRKVPEPATIAASDIASALQQLPKQQRLNQQTRAVHAAAFYATANGELLVREDVGRHNALDKTIGAVLRVGGNGTDGIILLTSRVSVDLIQKTASFGAGILAAVSVPSAAAVTMADAAGITLIGIARDDGFEVFTHPERITGAYAPCRSSG